MHENVAIAVLEGQGFSELLHTMEPTYERPSRKHVMTKLRELYVETKGIVERKLNEASSVALTLDFWTSHAAESYLGVTAHFISADWILCTNSVCTSDMEHEGAAHV